MWKNVKSPTTQKIENENKSIRKGWIYATIFQNKIHSKKLSTQNVAECYWFELAPRMFYNVLAKIIFIKVFLNY